MRWLAAIGLLVIVNLSYAQDIPAISFDQLEERINEESDTLFLFNFWATWCVPCIQELPELERIGETYADKKVKVVLVSLDFEDQHKARLVPFVKRRKLQSEVVHLTDSDYNAWIDKISPRWMGSIPATLIMDHSTRSRFFYEGALDYDKIESIIKPILKQKT